MTQTLRTYQEVNEHIVSICKQRIDTDTGPQSFENVRNDFLRTISNAIAIQKILNGYDAWHYLTTLENTARGSSKQAIQHRKLMDFGVFKYMNTPKKSED